jgi:hypothetical protein
MLELSLPACPICHAEDSLTPETMESAGQPFTWYECQECDSVLLWMGDDRWAYQKIAREDKAYLLKQPMTERELRELLPSTQEVPGIFSTAEVRLDTEDSEQTEGLTRKDSQTGKPTRLLRVGVAVTALVLIIGIVGLLGTAAGRFGGPASLWEPSPTPTPGPPRFAVGDEVVVPYKRIAYVWALGEDGTPRKQLGSIFLDTRPEVIKVVDVRAHRGEWYCYVPTPDGPGWILEGDLMSPEKHEQYLTEYFRAKERGIDASRATADTRERELYGSLIEYHVGGTASRVSITMENEAGGTEQFEYGTPYSTSFRRSDGFLYISVQNQRDSGSVTCRITVDGVVIQEAKSGPYVIATCSGSVP